MSCPREARAELSIDRSPGRLPPAGDRFVVSGQSTNSVSARMNPIRTTRLMLEPQVAAHADEMFAVLSDPAIYEHENEPPASVEWLRERFRKLESRASADGSEQWINWVIRLPSSGLVGFVQATVMPNGTAAIAYELNSRYWGRGIAAEAVRAMIDELVVRYHVAGLSAVLKETNRRSLRLLGRIGFTPASERQHEQANVEAGELLMVRTAPVNASNLP